MKIEKKNIGILDMNIDSIYLLNAVRNMFKNDDIYYVNDCQLETYEGLEVEDINNYVKKNIEYLLSKNVDVIVVADPTIIEYCEELVNNINVKVVNVVEEGINYINENFEYKNIGFLSNGAIIEANIYQKNFRYNHLYNMNADEMVNLVRTHLVKTTETFQEAKNIIAPVYKKDLDVIIPSHVNLLMIKTELFEFLKDVNIVPIDEIICDKLKQHLYGNNVLPIKAKGKTYLNLKGNDSIELKRFLKHKYFVVEENKE